MSQPPQISTTFLSLLKTKHLQLCFHILWDISGNTNCMFSHFICNSETVNWPRWAHINSKELIKRTACGLLLLCASLQAQLFSFLPLTKPHLVADWAKKNWLIPSGVQPESCWSSFCHLHRLWWGDSTRLPVVIRKTEVLIHCHEATCSYKRITADNKRAEPLGKQKPVEPQSLKVLLFPCCLF